MSTEQVKQWLEGLTEHVKIMCDKFGSQTNYARELRYSTPYYVNVIINKRYTEMSRNMILEFAEKANYERERIREIRVMMEAIPQSQWRTAKKEAAVLYTNARTRERNEDLSVIDQSNVEEYQKNNQPPRKAIPQDLFLINRYIETKASISLLPGESQNGMRMALLNCLKTDLNELKETDIC